MAISSELQPRPTRFVSFSFPTLRDWIGNVGWPILLKELRADFRKNRFFLTHTLCLAAIAIAILGKVWLQDRENVTSVQLGRALFDMFFVVQFVIVGVVFPAFTANAFTEERSRKSFDLLMTTDLRPSELVWGKFLATSIYCLMTVFATVPLLAVSTLFGGVQFEEIAAAYGILIGLTILIAMVGVFFSSVFGSNLRSTLASFSVVGSIVVIAFFTLDWQDFSSQQREKSGETIVGVVIKKLRDEPLQAAPAAGAAQYSAPTYFRNAKIWAVNLGALVLFAYLFLFTANRIRPASDDKSSKLRLLTLTLLVVFLSKGVLEAMWFPEVDPELYPLLETREFNPLAKSGGAKAERVMTHMAQVYYDNAFTYLWVSFVGLLVVALIFPTESLDLSRRLRAKFSRLWGPGFPLRVFAPGAFWGLSYLLLAVLVCLGGLTVLWWNFPPGLLETENRLFREIIFTMPFYFFAIGALGFLLSSWGFTHGYNFLTVFFLFIITLLLPVILRFAEVPDSIWACYYLSPITLYQSLDPASIDTFEEGPKFVLFGTPIIDVAKYVFGGLGVLFVGAGVYFARREGYPLVRMARTA